MAKYNRMNGFIRHEPLSHLFPGSTETKELHQPPSEGEVQLLLHITWQMRFI